VCRRNNDDVQPDLAAVRTRAVLRDRERPTTRTHTLNITSAQPKRRRSRPSSSGRGTNDDGNREDPREQPPRKGAHPPSGASLGIEITNLAAIRAGAGTRRTVECERNPARPPRC
jgi:hypothetical protein